MCSPSPPPAPDYEGAARATAEGDLEAARAATMANRPTQVTPWGTSSWNQEQDQGAYQQALSDWQSQLDRLGERPSAGAGAAMAAPLLWDKNREQIGDEPTQDQFLSDRWTQEVTLTPEQQRLFDIGQQSDIQMANLGLQGARQAGTIFQDPFSLESMGEMPNYQDQFGDIYGAMLGRVDQDIGRDREAMASQLVASGIPRGSEAFNREMERIDRQLTDARQQAELNATRQVGQRQQSDIENRRQQIAEMLTQRQTPLNEYSAFRTGTQVQMPQFGNFSTQGQTQGPDIMGAESARGAWDLAGWNADVAGRNALLGSGTQLGAAYLLSDIRAKENISTVGVLNNGLAVYLFNYKGDKKQQIGLMAQDVEKIKPHAVKEIDGMKHVDYGEAVKNGIS